MAILRVLYLAAGANDALHAQARYSMLSALAWGDGAERIHLHTDAPQRYRSLAGLVEMHAIANAEPGRIFQTKLAIIRGAAEKFASDAVLFCDADTFFVRPYEDLRARVLHGEFFLHRREYDVASHATPQMRKFRRALRGAGLAPEGAMWNSGVVGLPPGQARILDGARDAYECLSEHTKKKYLAEQFSLSQAISRAGAVAPAESWIFHYWYQKAAYTKAIQQRLKQLEVKSLADISTAIKAGRIILPAHAAKRHWWEKLLGKKTPEIRGLPK